MPEAHEVTITVNRASGVPLYTQVAEQLRAAITGGQLQPGDRMENEVALAERLRLSRPTVRRAIQELVEGGMLVRRRGLGTLIAHQQVNPSVGLSSLADDLAAEGRRPESQVLGLAVEQNPRAAARLGLPAQAALWHLRRIRLADGLPLALLHDWLPVDLIPLDANRLSDTGLYALLREHGIQPTTGRQVVGARVPTPAERRQLRIRGSAAVLTMTRLTFGQDGDPVEFGDHVYRGSDYRIDMHVEPHR